MWAAGAEVAAGPDPTLITAIATLLGVVVTTVGLIVVQAIKSRSERTAPSPPAPATSDGGTRMAERVAVLEHQQRENQQRDDDADTRDDLQDRAIRAHDEDLEALKRWAGRADPGWDR